MKRLAKWVFAGIVLASGALTALAAPPEGHGQLQPAEWLSIQQVIGD